MPSATRCFLAVSISSWLAAAVLSAAEPSAPRPSVAPRAYGLNDQVLNVGAAAFHPTSRTYKYLGHVNGYLVLAVGESDAVFEAPLALPPGALITGMCL
jgi:hypothetical protein